MNKIANYLTCYLVKKKVIEVKFFDIYRYGFSVIIEMGLSLITMLLLNAVIGTGYKGLIYLTVFISVRSFSGGIHLKKFYSCYSCSCIMYVVCMIVCKYIRLSFGINLIMSAVLSIFIYALTPVKQYGLDINAKEYQLLKKNISKVLFIWILFEIIVGGRVGDSSLMMYIGVALFTNFLSMIMGNIMYLIQIYKY